MAHRSSVEDLALHGVRVLGHAGAARVAGRYGLDGDAVEELLLDAEAVGWARRHTFAGTTTWALTASGRAEGEHRMAVELDAAGARGVVTAVHADFGGPNRRFGAACTDWQIRPTGRDPMAANDHADARWDHQVLERLRTLGRELDGLCARLADRLERFSPYPALYASALAEAGRGRAAWVDAPDRDSLHLVWIQLHEDLLATLGIPRGSDG